MKFSTQYERERQAPEVNDGKTSVDRAGYISAQKRIENIMFAGQRLVQSRREMFDFEGDKFDPSFSDPTRDPNYDMADAFRDNLVIQERLVKAKRDQLDKEALKASQTAQEARKEVPDIKEG